MTSAYKLDTPYIRVSPKRKKSDLDGREDWYPYYAGYSSLFVDHVLSQLELAPNSLVLDPWNGSGTTTEIAVRRGFHALGLDINPVMVVVGKAKMLRSCAYLIEATETLLSMEPSKAWVEEPLGRWFDASTAQWFRNVGTNIRCLSAKPEARADARFGALTPVQAFFFTALFVTARQLVAGLKSSNPTWVKAPKTHSEKISVLPLALEETFRLLVGRMGEDVDRKEVLAVDKKCRIRLADSRHRFCSPESVDAIISSPPYCTRIDYPLFTQVELGILGITDGPIRELRSRVIGTSTIHRKQPQPKVEWGNECSELLHSIATHDSHASSSYYLKTYLQYFDGAHRSLTHIATALVPGGTCVLVVQDSHYKEIRVDLATIYSEMAASVGLRTHRIDDYHVPATLGAIQPPERRYRAAATATESALWLAKNAD